MDATNRYVLMCQKCEEIQGLWKPRQCDFIINIADLEEGLSFCSPAENIVQVLNMYYGEQDGTHYLQECQDLKEQALWLPLCLNGSRELTCSSNGEFCCCLAVYCCWSGGRAGGRATIGFTGLCT